MHLYKSSHKELLSASCVIESITLLDSSLIYTDVCKLAVLTILKLECKDNRLCVFLGLQNDFLLSVVQVKSLVLNICWVWKIVDDTVQKWLDTLVLIGGTHEDWAELKVDCCSSDAFLQHLYSDALLKHSFHEGFVTGAH